MARCFLLILLTFLVTLVTPSDLTDHELILQYSNDGWLRINTDEPELPPPSILSATCNRGIWIMYAGTNFTYGGSIQPVVRQRPTCAPTSLTNHVRSARPVGDRSNYAAPAATLFSDLNLGGDDALVDWQHGLARITFPVISFLTINTHLEFFTGEDFGGVRACVTFDRCVDGVCLAYQWTEVGEVPFDIRDAKSARVGCNPEE